MSIELNSDRAVCYKCGSEFSRMKGYFPVSYAMLHKGVGYLHICKDCVDKLYDTYLSQCNDPRRAVRQVCRKLDLYWNDNIYEVVERKSTTRSMMTQYISKINSVTYAGKSYDNTLSEEGTLWNFGTENILSDPFSDDKDFENTLDQSSDDREISEEIMSFWGSGYTQGMYRELEKRFSYYRSRLPKGVDIDLGTETLLRQICVLEVNIARDSAAGRQVDKSVATLNTLLGSLNLKPVQRQDDSDSELSNTPLGVWLYRYENKRPLPEIDDDLKDVNGIKKYVFTWMGHLCKMLGKKNGFSKLYEDEIQRLRVERPEYSGEEDEEMYMDILQETEDVEL